MRDRQKAWDAENYTTIACRISKTDADKLRTKLSGFHLTRYTFLRIMCQWVISGRMDSILAAMENAFHGGAPMDEIVAELDGIVRGLDRPYKR